MAVSTITVPGQAFTTEIASGQNTIIYLDSHDKPFVGKLLIQYQNKQPEYRSATDVEFQSALSGFAQGNRGLLLQLDSAPTKGAGQLAAYDGATANQEMNRIANTYPIPMCGLCVPISFNGKTRLTIGNSASFAIGVSVACTEGDPVEFYLNQMVEFIDYSSTPPEITRASSLVPPYAVGVLVDVCIASPNDPNGTIFKWFDRNGNTVGGGTVAANPLIWEREIGVPPYADSLQIVVDSSGDPTAIESVYGNLRWRCLR